MMTLWGWACMLLLLLNNKRIVAFNLFPEGADVVQGGNTDDYFGYTVAFLTNPPRLIVGAPHSYSKDYSYNTERSGAVYVCSENGFKTCRQILLSLKEDRFDEAPGFSYRELRENAFIGAALDVNVNTSDVVVCAPLWRNIVYPSEYLVNGACYSLKLNSKPQKLVPMIAKAYQSLPGSKYSNMRGAKNDSTRSNEGDIFHFAYGEAGFSVHITSQSELLLGAPGTFNWAGSVIKYPPETGGINTYRDSSAKIPNPYYSYSHGIHYDSFTGYAVSSGVFGLPKKVLYVTSSPHSADYKGLVFIFQFPNTDESSLDVKATLRGTQMGAYFGYSVAVTDFDGDGLDDLLVGSPLFSHSNMSHSVGDFGSVFVYRSFQLWDSSSLPLVINGSVSAGARFGTAIGALADLDQDGFNDVAIGAPYEELGAIYIYRGSSYGLSPVASQRVAASVFHVPLAGFGFSISRAQDVDSNDYPDIAVGAYDSGHAVVIKSRRVVHLEARLGRFIRTPFGRKRKLMVEACLFLKRNKDKETMPLDVDINLQVDQIHKRAEPAEKTTVSLLPDIRKCTWLPVVLKPNDTWSASAQYAILPINLTVNMRECAACPVVSPSSNVTDSLKIQVVPTCEKDECVPIWKISYSFINFKDRFVIGSRDSLTVRLAVQNTGDNAFLKSFLLSLPMRVHLRSVPSMCNANPGRTEYSCLQGTRLTHMEKKSMEITFDVGNINSDIGEIALKVSAFGFDSENATAIIIEIPVISDIHLDINSRASPPLAVISQPHPQRPPNIVLNHNFETLSVGITPIRRANITITTPIRVHLDGGWHTLAHTSFKASMGEEAINCSPIQTVKSAHHDISLINYEVVLKCGDEGVECATTVCQAGPLHVQNSVITSVKVNLNLGIVDLLVSDKRLLVVNTSIISEAVGVENSRIMSSAITLIAGPKPVRDNPLLPLWIALAIAIAVAILAAVIVALWKCGFFKRLQNPGEEETHLDVGEDVAMSDTNK